MNETKPFDAAALQRLVRLGGEKFAGEMIDLFCSYGAKKLGEALAARQAGNLTALAEAVHPLKSSAGNVGAGRVQELAELVETAARASKAEIASAQLDELERAFAEARIFLEAEKARLIKPPA